MLSEEDNIQSDLDNEREITTFLRDNEQLWRTHDWIEFNRLTQNDTILRPISLFDVRFIVKQFQIK